MLVLFTLHTHDVLHTTYYTRRTTHDVLHWIFFALMAFQRKIIKNTIDFNYVKNTIDFNYVKTPNFNASLILSHYDYYLTRNCNFSVKTGQICQEICNCNNFQSHCGKILQILTEIEVFHI